MYDTKTALAAADAALVVVDGVSGVEVQTEKVWEFAEEFKLPRAFFINKLDRERSDFDRAVASIQEFFGRHAVPVALPIGAEKDFQGVVDLIRMKAYTYTPDGDGKGKEIPIPDSTGRARPALPRAAHREHRRGQGRADGGVLRHRHAAARAHLVRPARR